MDTRSTPPRRRFLLIGVPLIGSSLTGVRAQPTSSTQTSSPQQDEARAQVQVGAGTQGDVTTGSSGPQKKKAGKESGKGDARAANRDVRDDSAGAQAPRPQGARP